MAGKKIRDANMTKKQILQEAEKLFAEKGFAGTTLSEISKASNASGPLIVFHFKDKQGVYNAVKAEIIKRYVETDRKNSPCDDSSSAFIKHILSSMFQFYSENPTMMRMANWGRLEGDVESWPGEDEWHHIYLDCIRKAQERGEIRKDLTPLNISIMIFGVVHIWWEYHEHFLKHMNAGEQKEEADNFYYQQCLSFVLQGLSNDVCNLEIKKGDLSKK